MPLPFDDLVRIFEYLNLKDQLNVARSCPNFHDIIVNSIWRRRYSDVRITNLEESETCEDSFQPDEEIRKLGKADFVEFFRWNVCNLRKFQLENLSAQYWKHFLGHNLSRPDMDYYLTFNYTRLNDLACVNLSRIFHDGTMRHMAAHCPKVERLTVSSRNVTGQYLGNFRYLKSLSLPNCSLQISYLNELIENTQSLVELDVRGNEDLLKELVPTWGRSLKELQLDEDAFLKQFAFDQQLPQRFRNMRKFNIHFENAADKGLNSVQTENHENESITKWLTFLQNVGSSIKKFKLHTKSSTIYETIRSLYLKNGNGKSPIFENLKELHFNAHRNCLESLKYFFNTKSLEAAYIYCDKKCDYNLHDVIRLYENNEILKYLCINLGAKTDGEIFWRFLDDFISFKRKNMTVKPLKLELQKLYTNFSDNSEDQIENFRNLRSLMEIHKQLFIDKKCFLQTDFGLQIRFKSKAQSNSKTSDHIEICFEENLKQKVQTQHFNDKENVYIEPKIPGEEVDSYNYLNGF